MPFVGDFSWTQNDVNIVTLTDTSSGVDATITSRTINVSDYTNTVVYTTTWNIDDTSYTIDSLPDFLPEDEAYNINVVWNAPSPDPAGTYSVTKLGEFDFYNMIFLGQLIAERMSRYPSIVNDTNFMNNFFELYSYIVCARISTGLMNDITKTQISLDLATYRRNNQTDFF